MNHINSDKKPYLKLAIYSFILCTSIFLLRHDFGVLFFDSPSYINNSIFVNQLYPLIIDVIGFAVGKDNYSMISLVQFLMGFTILALSSSLICKPLKAGLILEIMFFTLIFSFYISTRGALAYSYATSIVTESLAYPWFFLNITLLLRLMIVKSLPSFYYFMTSCLVLYFLRSQFIIFFPVILIIFGLLYYWNKPQWLKLKILLAIFFVFIGGAFLPSLYNYFYFGKFIAPQAGGISILNTALYLARDDDEKLFDGQTKLIFTQAYAEALSYNALKYCNKSEWRENDPEQKNITNKFFSSNWYSPESDKVKNVSTGKVNRNYNIIEENGVCTIDDISHLAASLQIRMSAALNSLRMAGLNDWVVINPILMEISTKLIKKHFNEWIETCFKLFVYQVGSIYFLSMALILMAYLVIKFNHKKPEPFSTLLLIALVIHIGNSLFVSFVAPYNVRYTLYTFSLMAGIAVLSFQKLHERFPPKQRSAK